MMQPVKWEGGNGNALCPPSVFRRYLDINLARGLEEIEVGEPKQGPLYIVASGPSLIDTWKELKDRPGEIWALNAAFDFLCRQGVRPDYGVALAPEDPILNYFQEVRAGDKFLFGNMTNPRLIDRCLGYGCEVKLWQVASPAEWGLPVSDSPQVYGGGTIGTRALDLAYVLGWRDVHVLGLDGCLSPDGRIAVETPMYDELRHRLQTFYVNGRAFVAMPSHARQVEDFPSLVRPLTGMSVTLYGDGMLQWSQTPQGS